VVELDFKAFDADNHYYEAEDAFTRHIDPKMAKRCMQWATIDGKRRLLVGGKVNKFIPNPTFDPIARPGSLEDYFRGRNTKGLDLATMFGDLEPLSARPGYRDRAARLELMDRQGLEAALLFPTLGVGMQEALRHDIPALHAAFSAFNTWLDEDWGFSRPDGRLFAAPMLTLADPELAAAEVERVLGMGARIVVLVPGPVPTEHGYQSPGLPDYDPVWARLEEAGVPVALHAGLGGTAQYTKFWERPTGQFEGFRHSAFPLVAFEDRGIVETFTALICHGAFSRFPRLRWVSIENGAMWVPDLLRHLKAGYGKMPFAFEEDPVEAFHERVWVSPFYEDDMDMLADLLGVDRLLFGSDFPHAEGLPEPLDFVKDIPTFSPEQTRKVMRDNVRELLALEPAAA
jgi:predicted TIM-barrel fold metal-dependent hydrolase